MKKRGFDIEMVGKNQGQRWKQFGATRNPTYVFLRNNQVVSKKTGVQSERQLENMFRRWTLFGK